MFNNQPKTATEVQARANTLNQAVIAYDHAIAAHHSGLKRLPEDAFQLVKESRELAEKELENLECKFWFFSKHAGEAIQG